jgi:hypothetical protein
MMPAAGSERLLPLVAGVALGYEMPWVIEGYPTDLVGYDVDFDGAGLGEMLLADRVDRDEAWRDTAPRFWWPEGRE